MANRSDNFNDSGNVNLDGRTPSDGGSAWIEETAGTWKTSTDVPTGRIVAYNLGGPRGAWLEASETEVEVEADIVTVLSNVGVIGRVQDASNFYLWRSLSGTNQLYKQVSGSYTLLATGSITSVSGDRLKLRCDGSSIKGYVNGVEDASVTDSSLTTGTKVGIYGGAGYVDDFASTALGGAAGHPAMRRFGLVAGCRPVEIGREGAYIF